jgi:hypothetical protein
MAVPWDTQRMVRAVNLKQQAAPAQVVWDRTKNAFDTWRELLLDIGDRAAIVMEDDVVLTTGWRQQVEAVIDQHRQSLIQFFSLPRKSDEQGPHWEPGRTYLMNQCHYLPPGMATDLVRHSAGWVEAHPDNPTAMDSCMADYLKATGQRYWQHLPSLVQHEPWTSEINPKRPRNRQSRSFQP